VSVFLCSLSGFFALNNQTGALSLVKPLDYESSVQHTLNIAASDMGQPPRKAFRNVTIHVIDANDNSPALQARIIRASVLEVTSCFVHSLVRLKISVHARHTGEDNMNSCPDLWHHILRTDFQRNLLQP